MMRTALLLALGGLAVVTVALGANAQGRQRSAPEIYAATCAHCHAAGGWGTRRLAARVPAGEAELLNRKDLPPAFTRLVVRRGIGPMPPLTPTDVTDDELDRLARWLEANN